MSDAQLSMFDTTDDQDETPTRRTYRERREARAARLRGWAEKREAKAAAELAKADGITDMIPMGQPILVGHHSERRHRRALERADNAMRRSVESSDKAERMAGRADNIEAQLSRSIYSDDADAIDKLAARVAELEAERDRIKAYNASCRKGARDVSILTPAEQEDLAATAKACPYMIGKQGQMPAYKLTNLSGNIARNRKRLESLQRKAARD